MSDEIRNLVLQLRAWSEPIASGYEVPAAARTLHAAADALEAMAGERDRTRDDYEAMKAHNKELFGKLSAAELERDRLKDRLDCIDRDVAIGIGTVEAVKRLTAERDRLAGEVERLTELAYGIGSATIPAWSASKKHAELLNKMLGEAEAERDRLKAALDALEAVRSDLPKKVSEQWLYEGVRHWHRNCDWDDPRDGSPLDRGDGATVAKILNMIPRKALGGDAS